MGSQQPFCDLSRSSYCDLSRSQKLGMHRTILFFLYLVSGRIPDIATGYPVIEKAGYPAFYAAKEKLLNTAYNILQSFDLCYLSRPYLTFCDPL